MLRVISSVGQQRPSLGRWATVSATILPLAMVRLCTGTRSPRRATAPPADGRAVAIEDGDQVDEGAAAAAGDEDDDGGVGEAVTVGKVSEGDGVADDAGGYPLRRTIAEDDLAGAVGELDGGVVVAEERAGGIRRCVAGPASGAA